MQVRFLVQDDRALLRGPFVLTAAAGALSLEVAKAMAAYHYKFAFKEEDQREGKLASLRLRGRVQQMLVCIHPTPYPIQKCHIQKFPTEA